MSTEAPLEEPKTKFLRRPDAAKRLRERFGFGSQSMLAKGVVTGDTPEYRKVGRIVIYEPEALDRWALSKISGPRTSSSTGVV